MPVGKSLAKIIKKLSPAEKKVLSEADDIIKNAKKVKDVPIDAEFRDVTNSMPPSSKSKLGKAVLGTGLGLAGLSLLGNGGTGDIQPPAPEQLNAIEPSPIAAPVPAPVKKAEKKVTKKPELPVEKVTSPEIVPASPENEMPVNIPKSQILDVGQASSNPAQDIKDAQEHRDRVTLVNQLAKAGEIIGTGIAGSKPVAQGLFDENIKRAGQGVEDVKERVEQEKNDPNSPVSKSFREYAKTLGFDIQGDFTANMGEKLTPYLFKGFEAEEARKSKAFEAEENRKSRESEAQKTRESDERKYKFLADARAHEARIRAQERKDVKDAQNEMKNDNWVSQRYDKLTATPTYKAMNKIQRGKTIIDQAIKNPSGVGDVSTLYAYISTLDPDSVVREGEIKLTENAYGLWGNLKNKLTKLGPNPRVIPNDVLKDIKTYNDLIYKATRSQYDSIREPVFEQARSRGIKEDRFGELDPIYLYEKNIKADESLPPKVEMKVQKLMENNPGLDRKQAIDALKQKGLL